MSELPASAEGPPEDFEGRVRWVNNKAGEILQQSGTDGQAAVFSSRLEKLLLMEDSGREREDSRFASIFTAIRREGIYVTQFPNLAEEPFQMLWEIPSENEAPTDFAVVAGPSDKNQSLEALVEILTASDLESIDFIHPTQWVQNLPK